MTLQPLTSFENLEVGDIFTMITPDFEDHIIQFVGRNPMIKNKKFQNNSGYFTTMDSQRKCFWLSVWELKNSKVEYYIGYDKAFVLKRRIEKIKNELLQPLQDQLLMLETKKS